jgi:hypothetical protein
VNTPTHKPQHLWINKLAIHEQAQPEEGQRYSVEIEIEHDHPIQKPEPIQTAEIEIALYQGINHKR